MPIYTTQKQRDFIHKNKYSMTQKEIAEKIGVSRFCVNKHIRGNVDVKNIKKNLPKKRLTQMELKEKDYTMPDKEFFDDKDFEGII